MGLRFRKTLKIFSGLKLNFSGSGVSLTVGGRGHSVTYSKKGTYVNLGIPGTGISYRKKVSGGTTAKRTRSGGGRISPYRPSARTAAAPPCEYYHYPELDMRIVWALAEEAVTLPAISVDYVQRRCQVQRDKAEEILTKLCYIGVTSYPNQNGLADVKVRSVAELDAVWEAHERPRRPAHADTLEEGQTMPVNSQSEASGFTFGSKGCLLVTCLLIAILFIFLFVRFLIWVDGALN